MNLDFKIETGVMVVKEDKAWGKIYEDGRECVYGWTDPANASIYLDKFVKSPIDVTYHGSSDVQKLKTGRLVHVRKTTIIEEVLK